MKNHRILFVGGHTGGHLYPAEALATVLLEEGVGTPVYLDHLRSQESKVFNEAGMEKVVAPWHKKGRYGSVLSVCAARSLLQKEKISAVMGFGAFPSIAPGLAAKSLGIPLFLHEQNRVMGLANHVLKFFASKIFLSFPVINPGRVLRSRSAILGCPVRPDFQPQELKPGVVRLLILGGSQGATEVNRRVVEAAKCFTPSLRQEIEILHMTGESTLDQVRRDWNECGFNVRVVSFIKDIAHEMDRAHLVVGRSGGSTLAEMMALGRPGVFFPIQSHRDEHQKHNACFLQENGAGFLVDSDTAPIQIAKQIEELLLNKTRLQEMAEKSRQLGRPRAAQSIAEMIRIHLEAHEHERFDDRQRVRTQQDDRIEA